MKKKILIEKLEDLRYYWYNGFISDVKAYTELSDIIKQAKFGRFKNE